MRLTLCANSASGGGSASTDKLLGPSMLHAKTFVADRAWSSIGSSAGVVGRGQRPRVTA